MPQSEQAWAVLPGSGGGPALNFPEYQAPHVHNFVAFTPTFLRSLTPHAAALLLLLALALRLGKKLAQIKNREGRATGGAMADAQSGASVIEFALILPLLLTLLLLVLQIALIVQAKFVVNYAAFCAARSAIVTIPAKIYSTRTRRYEINNAIDLNNPASPKMSIIRRAAALPCTAISPITGLRNFRLMATTTTLPMDPMFFEGLLRVSFYPGSVKGRRVGQELFERATYAFDKNNTTVEVRIESGGSDYVVDEQGLQRPRRGFKDHDLVTVRVKYRYYLAIPGANRLIGTAYLPGLFNFLGRTAYYAEMTEEYTLPLEGEPLYPSSDKKSWPDEVEEEHYE